MNVAEAGSWCVPGADGRTQTPPLRGRRIASGLLQLFSAGRAAVRLLLMSLLMIGAAILLLLSRVAARYTSLLEARRITVGASRAVLRVLDVHVQVVGRPCDAPALLVCNHLSWIDILVMHSVFPEASFIAKDDVADWPLIGFAAKSLDTVFVARSRKRDLLRSIPAVATTLQSRAVVLFAEGTTTDGSQTLPFKTSLFEAIAKARVPVVPVSLRALIPAGAASVRTHVAWHGDTTLLQHLPLVAGLPGVTFVVRVGDPLQALAAPRKRLGHGAHRAVVRQAGQVASL